jgi:hypothetical protein
MEITYKIAYEIAYEIVYLTCLPTAHHGSGEHLEF